MWIYWIIRFSFHSFSDQQLCVLSPNWWKQRYHQHFDIFPQTRRPWQTFGMPSFRRGDSWLYCWRFKTIAYSLWVSFSDLDIRVVISKFSFSEKATQIWLKVLMLRPNFKTLRQIAPNFCGLLGKAELYIQVLYFSLKVFLF